MLNATKSEDSLFLNVWTPNSTRNASAHPVMVWIHGGAFMTGVAKLHIFIKRNSLKIKYNKQYTYIHGNTLNEYYFSMLLKTKMPYLMINIKIGYEHMRHFLIVCLFTGYVFVSVLLTFYAA